MKHPLIAHLAPLVLVAAAHAQGTIALKASARVPGDAPVLLTDVATLMGPEAEALAGVAVVPAAERAAGSGRESVSADRVRAAISAWEPGAGRPPVNWGRLSLGGGTCVILPPLSLPAAAGAERPAQPAAPPESGTIRGVIAARIGLLLGAQRADLRLAFDPADRDILDLSAADRTVDAHPTGMSERLPLAVTVYETAGGRIVAAKTVRVGVQVRRTVVLAAAAKRRGDLIGPADVATEERWVAPATAALALEKVIGASVKSRLVPGDEVTERDIEPPVVVGKGDLVSVHCVSGLVVVRMTARALAEARDGEIVKLRSLTDEDRTFYGRMDGRGRAVAVAPQTEGQR